MKRMKKILACVLAGAALLTATGCSGSQDPKRLLVAHGHGDWHPVHIGLSTMCDEMEKLGEEIGVSIRCQREDIFEKMHRL